MKEATLDRYFHQAVEDDSYLYSVYLELSHACNFNCVHCYLPKKRVDAHLSFQEYQGLLDEFLKAELFMVAFTGGEPLLHPDFHAIYQSYKEAGLLVSLMTNGYLLDKSHFDLFKALPPRSVEVTLYGLEPSVFWASTQTRCEPNRVVENIRQLRSMGIEVAIKAVMTTLNQHEIKAYREFAESVGAEFRYDVMIHPALNQADDMLKYQVAEEAILETDQLNIPHLLKEPFQLREHRTSNPGKRRFQCGISRNSLVVDPEGFVHPCLLYRDYRYNVRKTPFSEVIMKRYPDLKEMTRAMAIPCDTCSHTSECDFCEATLLMYQDNPDVIHRYCEITNKRVAFLKELVHDVSKT